MKPGVHTDAHMKHFRRFEIAAFSEAPAFVRLAGRAGTEALRVGNKGESDSAYTSCASDTRATRRVAAQPSPTAAK